MANLALCMGRARWFSKDERTFQVGVPHPLNTAGGRRIPLAVGSSHRVPQRSGNWWSGCFSDGSRNKLVCFYPDIYVSYHVIITVTSYTTVYAIYMEYMRFGCEVHLRFLCPEGTRLAGPWAWVFMVFFFGSWTLYSFNCRGTLHPSHLGVSKNNGTPKSSILIWFSIINHPF